MITPKEKRLRIREIYLRYKEPTIEEQLLIKIVSWAVKPTEDGRKVFIAHRGTRKSLCRSMRITRRKYDYALRKLLACGIISIHKVKHTRQHQYYVVAQVLEPFANE